MGSSRFLTTDLFPPDIFVFSQQQQAQVQQQQQQQQVQQQQVQQQQVAPQQQVPQQQQQQVSAVPPPGQTQNQGLNMQPLPPQQPMVSLIQKVAFGRCIEVFSSLDYNPEYNY